jgi:hypothetical protein
MIRLPAVAAQKEEARTPNLRTVAAQKEQSAAHKIAHKI